jgi:hypothetical protein
MGRLQNGEIGVYCGNVEICGVTKIFILYLKAKSLKHWVVRLVKLSLKEMYLCCLTLN